MAIDNIDELDNLNTGRVKLNEAIDQANTVQGQLDTIVIASGTSDAETIQARGGEPLLYNRLDKVDAQLAETTLSGRTLKFENVANMISDQKPKIGDIVEFMGYYNFDDGGGHTRVISDTNNLLSVILDNGLFANITGDQDDLRNFGIKFGDNTAKVANTVILKNVLTYYNGFIQKKRLIREIVNVIDFHHTITNNYFEYENIAISVEVVNPQKNYIIGIESSVAYIMMKNFQITNANLSENRANILKMYAVKLADNVNTWGGVKYNIEDATITGYSVPLFSHSWDSSVKNINFAFTDTGCILFGTSTTVSSIYTNKSLYGNILGACYDIITDTFSIATHSLLFYSTLQGIANDWIEKNIMVLGKTVGVQVGGLGMENPLAGCESVFKAINSDSEIFGVDLLSSYLSSVASDLPMYLVTSDEDYVFTLNINGMTNTSIKNIKNQSSIVVNILNQQSYRPLNFVGNFDGKLIMNNQDTAKKGEPKTINFTGVSKGYAGTSDLQFIGNKYEIETFITRNQRIKIPITPLQWSTVTTSRRAFKITAELSISDCDNQSSRSINNIYFITSHTMSYVKDSTVITPFVKRLDDTITDNLTVSVDNTGDYPMLIIELPTSTLSYPGSYYLSGKISTGMKKENVTIENY